MVATDIFGRGLDINSVNLIINYGNFYKIDFPNNKDIYLHRMGRACRFGKQGVCISFIKNDN